MNARFLAEWYSADQDTHTQENSNDNSSPANQLPARVTMKHLKHGNMSYVIHCRRYERYRDILREAYEELSLPEILGTPNGIDALCEFLRQSGAFSRTGAVLQMQPQPLPENEPTPPAEDTDDETSDDEE